MLCYSHIEFMHIFIMRHGEIYTRSVYRYKSLWIIKSFIANRVANE